MNFFPVGCHRAPTPAASPSQRARLPLDQGTALVDSPLSLELSGWLVHGVASPVTSTIRSMIRSWGMIWSLFLPRPGVRERRQSTPRCAPERAPVESDRATSMMSSMTCERMKSSPASRRLDSTTENCHSCVRQSMSFQTCCHRVCVSSLAYPNMVSWSPAPTSRSSLPTLTLPAKSGLCLLTGINTSQS